MSLNDIFLPISIVDGQKRCHCGGQLTVTVKNYRETTLHWGKCQSCGDGGAVQISGTSRSTYSLSGKTEGGE